MARGLRSGAGKGMGGPPSIRVRSTRPGCFAQRFIPGSVHLEGCEQPGRRLHARVGGEHRLHRRQPQSEAVLRGIQGVQVTPQRRPQRLGTRPCTHAGSCFFEPNGLVRWHEVHRRQTQLLAAPSNLAKVAVSFDHMSPHRRHCKGPASPVAVPVLSKGDAGAGEAAAPAAGSDTPLCSCHCARDAAAARLRTTSTSCRVRATPSNAAYANATAPS